MTHEEIQLLSDAIKLGFPVLGTLLGGIIGALTTFLITRANHKNDRAKEELKKRYELILQAANDITEFEHLIGTYATAISNHVQGLKGAIDMESARHEIVNRNQPLRRARMVLKLLNLKEAETHLESYIETTREVISKGPNLKPERASELAKIITRGPVQFYESLAPELSGAK
jgi:gas vesicle protein